MSRYAPSLPWQRHGILLKTVCPPLLALLECSAARKWSRKLKRGQFVFDASFICARAPSNRFRQTRCKTRQNWFLRSRKWASFFPVTMLWPSPFQHLFFVLQYSLSAYFSFFNIRFLYLSFSLFPFFNLTSCRQRCFNCFHISSFFHNNPAMPVIVPDKPVAS